MRQPHRSQEQQTVQEKRVEREREKRKKEERELDGKEERRGTEGERVARKEGKENEVEKDVTGWTEVTRNKRKKMVQIFVKVDEMKTVAMEASPEDKVQKILNTVSGSEREVYVTSGGRIQRGSDKLKSCGVRDGSAVQVMSRMRGGGKHKDKKGKEEKKQVAQLDDGMCAMACEQMRQVMETLKTLADNSTGEDKRCVVEKVEEARKAIIGLRKQTKGEDLQRVAELEESLKKLEEMLPWSVEEQEQRRQKEQQRQGEQEEQRRQEEQEQRRQEEQGQHPGQEQSKQGKRMGFGEEEHLREKRAKSTDEPEVMGRLAEARTGRGSSGLVRGGDERCRADETRKGKGKGNGGKGDHEGNSVMDGDQGNTGVMRSVEKEEDHREDVRKLVEMMQKEDEEQEAHKGSARSERCEVCGRVEVWCEEQEERRGQGGEGARQKMPSEENVKDERTAVAPNTGAGGSHPRAMTDPEEEVKSEREVREEKEAREEARAHEARDEKKALEAREEEKRAQEAREEQRRAQEAPELRRSEREVSAQEEQAEQEREVEAHGGHESEVKAQKGHEGEVKAQGGATRKCEFSARGVPRVEQTHDMVAQRMVDPC